MGLEMFQLQNKMVGQIHPSSFQIQETNARLGVGLLAMFFYLLIGAFVFVRIEAPREAIELEAYIEFRDYWTQRMVRAGFDEDEIDRLFANIRDAALNGIWVEKNVTNELNWSFGQAFFFSGTLISTVGYGNVAPRTHEGKLFTIIYCIIGIPLTLALLSALVVRLRQPSQWLRGVMNKKLGHLFHTAHLQLFHLLFVTVLLLVFAFLIPSLIFTSIEDDWEFLDAFYYCFVSLTTIGLGNQVPGDSPEQQFRAFYKVLTTVYLLLGLCGMMLFLATLYDIPQLNLMKFFIIKDDGNDAYGDGEKVHINRTNGGPKYSRQMDDEDSPPGIPTNYMSTNGFYQQPTIR
ncbi:hypothetical protein QR680_006102 [Steinernema hermaphroditum]|uniref:Two pore potassium channel protein sup-9 n=1 Tax=Steinernema hermaphroditum TaxID=289476 RepID=A0AA39HVF2_9BILA|nr:hypothetical protein QR680_006102 [Steinernema hermaphroditum]